MNMSYFYDVLVKNLGILYLCFESLYKIKLYIDRLMCFNEKKNCRQESIVVCVIEVVVINKEILQRRFLYCISGMLKGFVGKFLFNRGFIFLGFEFIQVKKV